MANTVQDGIYRSFLEASRRQAADAEETKQSLADLILQAGDTRREIALQTAGTATSSRGKTSSTASDSSGSSVLSDVLGVFRSGLGLSPLLKGVFSLFGGDGEEAAPAPLVKYALPPAIDFQAAEVGGRLMNVDYDQAGVARAYSKTSPTAGQGPANTVSQPPQITVNVSAMDARSFLDRSNDIAAAVREAMLNLNSINDVVNEL